MAKYFPARVSCMLNDGNAGMGDAVATEGKLKSHQQERMIKITTTKTVRRLDHNAAVVTTSHGVRRRLLFFFLSLCQNDLTSGCASSAIHIRCVLFN